MIVFFEMTFFTVIMDVRISVLIVALAVTASTAMSIGDHWLTMGHGTFAF